MKIYNIPFLIVFISILFPMIGALLNIPVYHNPAGLVFLVLLILFSQRRIVLRKNILNVLAIPALLIFVTQLLTGRGFVTLAVGGYVFIFALVFFVMLSMGTGCSLVSMTRGISFLYKIFLVLMLIEMLIILFGFQPQLAAVLRSGNSPGYKTYNSADILRYFGLFHNAGGLNSILLGSQIAGMLSLFSVIWFVGIRRLGAQGLEVVHSGFWIGISSFCYIITVNGTNLLLGVLACSVYSILINKKHRVGLLSLFGLLIGGLYLLISKGFILSRVFNQRLIHLQPETIEYYQKYGISDEMSSLTTIGYYINQFSSPVINWLAEDWVNKLLGVGKQYFLKNDHFVAGDFGFAIGMLSSGLLWVGIFSIAVLAICIPVLTAVESGSRERELWSVFGATNALITLLWLASTVHYIQAFANPGGITVFALHFAAALYCSYRRSLYKSGTHQLGLSRIPPNSSS